MKKIKKLEKFSYILYKKMQEYQLDFEKWVATNIHLNRGALDNIQYEIEALG